MIAVTQENSSCNQQSMEVGERFDSQQLLQENRLLRWERGQYKSLLDRAREELLKQEIGQLNARIRYLEKRAYGRKSEKDTCMPMRPVGMSSSLLRVRRVTVGICGFLFRTVPLSIF